LLAELDARAATSSDVLAQMQSLEPLARVARYGDVRGTRAEHVIPVLHAVFERVIVGLLPACTQIDDAAASELTVGVAQAHGACLLLDDGPLTDDWLSALRATADSAAAHARVRGRTCRLLLAQKALTPAELSERASLALSSSVEPAHAAQWVEGLVAGEGLLLVHQEELLSTLDAWMSALPDDTFQAQLPILRRAFSDLQAAERRAIAQRLKAAASPGSLGSRKAVRQEAFDEARVELLLPVLARILGVKDV